MKKIILWIFLVCTGILFADEVGADIAKVSYSLVGLVVTGYLLGGRA